jgi:hypothetical protein
MNSEKADLLLEDIAKMFSTKEFPDMCAKAFITNATDKPSSSWSIGNQILMIFSGTCDARGFRQWEQAKRHVRKGAKAIYILAPIQKKVKAKDSDEDKIVTIGFRGMPVFRYEDTEGQPLKEFVPAKLPPLFGLAEKNGISVAWKNSSHGEYGSIDIINKSMILCTESPDTFLHELVHWYDAKNEKLKPGQDQEQETVAQLGACVLAKMYGYDTERYTWNYIASYANTDSPQEVGQMCFKVLGMVQKAINAILDDASIQTDIINVR